MEGLREQKEGLRRHQRTYSDSMLTETEEVPFWLKELLDDDDDDEDDEAEAEIEIPICRTHRRSASDSTALAYQGVGTGTTAAEASKRKERKNKKSTSGLITPQEYSDATQIQQNVADPSEASFVPHLCLKSNSNPSSARTDSKRVKRHSAQQHRARKLQYIAELERSVQVLQAEGSEVSAELEFLDQQNLILRMENRALKQRLDSLSQEQFIKCLEHEILEKELARLRNLYQQRQQKQQHKQQQKHYGRPRSKSRDLESSVAKLSLKNKEVDLQSIPDSFHLKKDIHEFTH